MENFPEKFDSTVWDVICREYPAVKQMTSPLESN